MACTRSMSGSLHASAKRRRPMRPQAPLIASLTGIALHEVRQSARSLSVSEAAMNTRSPRALHGTRAPHTLTPRAMTMCSLCPHPRPEFFGANCKLYSNCTSPTQRGAGALGPSVQHTCCSGRCARQSAAGSAGRSSVQPLLRAKRDVLRRPCRWHRGARCVARVQVSMGPRA